MVWSRTLVHRTMILTTPTPSLVKTSLKVGLVTGLNNVWACARSHGSCCCQWPEHHNTYLEKMTAFLKVSYDARFMVKR